MAILKLIAAHLVPIICAIVLVIAAGGLFLWHQAEENKAKAEVYQALSAWQHQVYCDDGHTISELEVTARGLYVVREPDGTYACVTKERADQITAEFLKNPTKYSPIIVAAPH